MEGVRYLGGVRPTAGVPRYLLYGRGPSGWVRRRVGVVMGNVRGDLGLRGTDGVGSIVNRGDLCRNSSGKENKDPAAREGRKR